MYCNYSIEDLLRCAYLGTWQSIPSLCSFFRHTTYEERIQCTDAYIAAKMYNHMRMSDKYFREFDTVNWIIIFQPREMLEYIANVTNTPITLEDNYEGEFIKTLVAGRLAVWKNDTKEIGSYMVMARRDFEFLEVMYPEVFTDMVSVRFGLANNAQKTVQVVIDDKGPFYSHKSLFDELKQGQIARTLDSNEDIKLFVHKVLSDRLPIIVNAVATEMLESTDGFSTEELTHAILEATRKLLEQEDKFEKLLNITAEQYARK